MNLAESGALARMGIVTTPIGTLEEVRSAGLNPETVACCHQRVASNPGGGDGVRGCPVWRDCRFHQPDMGGFKGQGPRNVPYLLTTLDGRSQMNFVPCYSFVRTLQGRMDHANAERVKGKTHETIRIIGREGDTIKMNIARNDAYDPRLARQDNGMFTTRVEDVVVTPHPRPNQLQSVGFEAEIRKLEEKFAERDQAVQEANSIMPMTADKPTRQRSAQA